MKVLLLGPYPPPHGGVQTNLVAIRSFLLRNGVPCSVINITRHRKPDADEVYYPKSAIELVQLLARLKYDLIHLHIGGMLSNRVLSLSLICARWPGKKSVMTFHSGGFPSTPEGQALGPASFTGFVLRSFDAIIGVNEEIIRFLQKMGVPSERARLISPYAFLRSDSEMILPPVLSDFFAVHDPVLTSVGLLEPEYDLPLQIDALTPIREKFPKAGLLLIGSGSLESNLRHNIASNPSGAHILLAGDVLHAATMEAMVRSRVILRTTLYDGDALSVREALQLGTPVIASDNGMRPAGVRLIPKSDLQALVKAIEMELQNSVQPKTLTIAEEGNIRAVFDFYQELMGQK
jgi:glycosyltransferase involved in cell wall biosynthesis